MWVGIFHDLHDSAGEEISVTNGYNTVSVTSDSANTVVATARALLRVP
jgi:hypothetical protein